ncbi:unnamed protein product [Symbiodinium sp. CCMP2592]|nr:unnamed protein product [Symbiodinium sp. CCMP2592]
MGGKKWTAKEWKEWRGGRPPWPGRVWPGSYAASPRAKSANTRPSYDQVELPSTAAPTIPTENIEGYNVMREVQKAVSIAKKADNKVRRLREEKTTKEAQWKLFAKKAKEDYVAELTRYESALQRIDQEIQDSTTVGQDAARSVQAIVNGERPAAAVPMENVEDPWDTLLSTTEVPAQAGFLQDALAAANMIRTSGAPSNGPGQCLMTPEAAARLLQATLSVLPHIGQGQTTPPGLAVPYGTGTLSQEGHVTGAGHPPAANLPAGLPTPAYAEPPGAGPYQTSPATTRLKRTTSASPRINPYETRGPVKEPQNKPGELAGGDHAPAPSLEERVQNKRSSGAMFPFGLRPDGHPGHNANDTIVVTQEELQHAVPGQTGDLAKLDVSESIMGLAPLTSFFLLLVGSLMSVIRRVSRRDDLEGRFCPSLRLPCTFAFGDNFQKDMRVFFASDLDFVEPQPEEGYVSLILVPQWLERSVNAEIVLDFSAVGGPVYAVIVERNLPHAQLIEHASRHTVSPWDAFQTGSSEPLCSDRSIRVTTGDTIKFVAVYGSPFWYPATVDCLRDPDFLSAEVRQIISEEVSDSWLVLAPSVDREILHPGQPDEDLASHAASALHCRQEHLMLCKPDKDSFHPYVHQGALLAGVIAARKGSRSELDRANRGTFLILDCRPIGRQPTFYYTDDQQVEESVLQSLIVFSPPRGYRPLFSGLPKVGSAFCVHNGGVLTVDLEPFPLLDVEEQAGDSLVNSATIGMRNPYHMPGGCQGVPWQRATDVHRTVHPPARYDDEAHAPPPTVYARDKPQGVPPPTFLHGHFLVFAPRYRAEVLPLVMRVPCDPEDALNEVQDARNEDQSLYFDTLVPVEPQPDNRFACILSSPVWAADRCHVLVDLRHVDGRLFSIIVPAQLSRASLLSAVQLTDALELNIFFDDRLQPRDRAIVPENGGLFTLLRGGRRPGPLYTFEELLGSERHWAQPCPMYPGPVRSALLVFNDSAPRAFSYDQDPADDPVEFRRAISAQLGYSLSDSVLHRSCPAIEDIEHFGHTCKALCVATQRVGGSTVSADGAGPCTAIIDTRPILRDIEWVLTNQGVLDFDALCARFEPAAPPGYAVSIKGGRHELRTEGTYVHVPQAGILVVQFVQDFLENSPGPSGLSSQELEGEDEHAESESASSDSSMSSVDNGAAEDRRERSRSPRRTDGAAGHAILSPGILASLFGGTQLQVVVASNFPPLLTRRKYCLLTALCQLPRSLGEQVSWTYSAPFDHREPLATDTTGFQDELEQVSEDRRLYFVVATPEYTLYQTEVTLTIPAVPPEALAAVRAARPTTDRRQFPILHPANPQPIAGCGLFLAEPSWGPQPPTICFDTRLIDGRLFAKSGRSYADRFALVHAAGLSAHQDLDVYVGYDSDPLPDGAELHLTSGDTIRIVPAGTPAEQPVTLAECLGNPTWWSVDPFTLPPCQVAAYGLVFDGFMLCPANPRITDCVVAGCPVRAVIGVVERDHADSNAFCVLVDCRPLRNGWFTVPFNEGRVDAWDILDILDGHAPRGWRAVFVGHPSSQRHAAVHPGQVLVAEYIPSRAASLPPNASDNFAGASDISAPAASLSANDRDTAPTIRVARSDPLFDSAPSATAHAAGPTSGHGGDDTPEPPSFAEAVFCILGQHYEVEVVRVRIPLGIGTAEVLEAVSAARDPAIRSYLPRVGHVPIQSLDGVAVLIGLPLWDPSGALVVLDSTRADGQIHVAQLPGIVQREGLLVAAGFPPQSDLEVYLKDIPWPIQHGTNVTVSHGDIAIFVPPRHTHFTTTTLSALLSSAEHWDPSWTPTFSVQEHAWVLGPQAAFSFTINPARRSSLKRDLSVAVGVIEASLILCSPEPLAPAYTHLGVVQDLVVAALTPALYTMPQVERHAVCFIDARPLLLRVECISAPGGVVTCARLNAQFASRCPTGFALCYFEQDGFVHHVTQDIWVEDLDVLILTFLPCSFLPDSTAGSNTPPPDGPPSHDADGSDGHQEDGDSAEAPAVLVHSLLVRRVPVEWPFTRESRPSVMWNWVTFHHALWRGPPGDTSDDAAGFFRVFLLSLAIGHFLLTCCLWAIRRMPWLCVFALLHVQFNSSFVEAVQLSVVDKTAPVQETNGQLGQDAVRPVPTPCRSHAPFASLRAPAFSDAAERDSLAHAPSGGWELDCELPLHTLLEYSRAESQDYPLFLAWTLLEALLEHQAPGHGEAHPIATTQPDRSDIQGPRPGRPEPLRLSSHLPACQTFDLSVVSVDIGTSLDQVMRCICPGSFDLNLSIPDSIDIHPAAQSLLDCCNTDWLEDEQLLPKCFDAVTVFTDGSFDGDVSSWACAAFGYRGQASYFLGWQAGLVQVSALHPAFVGAPAHSALAGEYTAIIWAIYWGMQAPACSSLEYLADCLSALQQANGAWGCNTDYPMMPAARALLQLLCAVQPAFSGSISHVRSHQGQPDNELVDSLAKFAVRNRTQSTLSTQAHSLAQAIRDGSVHWWWLIYTGAAEPQAWPSFQGAFLTDHSRFADAQPPSTSEARAWFGFRESLHTQPDRSQLLSLRLLTVNVQTLNDSSVPEVEDKGFKGRAGFLREQLVALDVHVAALQETRASASDTITSKSHIRFCSGKDTAGNHGVEIWFSRLSPFLSSRGIKSFFQPGDFIVTFADPRTLIVRFARGGIKILFVCVHGPTTCDPQRDLWWASLHERLHRFSEAHEVVLLGDYNVHFSLEIPGRVGSLVLPGTGTVPSGLQRILHTQDLWIPSTFPDIHHGPSLTWISPSGLSGSRIDFVGIPCTWVAGPRASCIQAELDWGQAHTDHFAAQVDVSSLVKAITPGPSKFRVDREAIGTAEGQATLAQVWRHAPTVPWSTNVRRHWAALEAYLQTALPRAFPSQRGQCRSSHFSEYTWQLRQRRVWLRRQILRCRESLLPPGTRAPFLAWRRQCRLRVFELCSVFIVMGRQRRLASFAQELRQTRKALRQAVRRDVRQRITDVAAEAEHCATAEAVRRLKPLLGPPKRKARTHNGLPLVLTSTGVPAATSEEVEDTWIQHFAGIEDGCKILPQELAASCMHIQASRDLDSLLFSAADLPSRIELETALRDTSTGRAAGLDGVPGEALHFAVATASKVLYPLLLKTSMRLAEPVQFKGGSLEAAWKGKGSPALCASHRGILISAVTGKAFHRLLRSRCVGPLSSVTSPLQLEGLPSCPVTAVSHAVRLFVASARAKQQSFAILFLDLQEAFYRVCRPLLTGAPLCDEAIAKVAQTIRLPAGVMHELHLHLSGKSIFEDSGASPWLSQAMSEVLASTWFRFKAGPSLVQTGIGSRPGDNCADVIFSFLFSRVLRELSRDLVDMGCLTHLPFRDSMQGDIFSSRASEAQPIDIMDATWMDDLALMMLADSAEAVITKARHVTGALLDACLSRALLPNLARGKTELIIVPCGKGSKACRAALFRDKDPSVEIPSRLWQQARVRVVHFYRHLGGVIHFSGDVAREIRSRVGMAHEAFQKRKRQIFGSPIVPKTAKATLFNSLILSVLLHGAGTWPALRPAAQSALSAAYERMACHMCRPHWDFDQAMHAGRDQVLAFLGLPSMFVLLHVHRLRHLLLFVRLGLKQMWALAHWEEAWLGSVRESLSWLWQTTRSSTDTRRWTEVWPEWLTMIGSAPGRWKNLLRRAQARAVQAEAWQAAHQQHCALLVQQLRLHGASLHGVTQDRLDSAHCCALCRTTFPSKQKWSVHAFKCHGRRMTGRGILSGLQCQACLRTYSNNVRLCRHLRYSRSCRDKLLSNGYACEFEPGVGHRKVDDRMAGLCPALPGSGPIRQFAQTLVFPQEDCPVAEVWDCLLHLDFDGPVELLSDSVLWDRLRIAFSCVCAPTDRLRATAQAWLETLCSSGGHERLITCAEWICQADIVQWIVPDPAVAQSVFRTYRDAACVVSVIDTAPICLGSPLRTSPAHTVVWVHPDSPWCAVSRRESGLIEFTHAECLEAFRIGKLPSFMEGPFEEVAFVLDLLGLHFLSAPSCPDLGISTLCDELEGAVLGADLLRFFLKLALLRIPALLLVSSSADLCVQSVSSLRGLSKRVRGDHCVISTCDDLCGLLVSPHLN